MKPATVDMSPPAVTGRLIRTSQLRDVCRSLSEASRSRAAGAPAAISELGARLRQIRARILASGLAQLDWEQIEADLAARRGPEKLEDHEG